jgi:hypothetical protein
MLLLLFIFMAITDKDTHSNLPCKILAFTFRYCLMAAVYFLCGCIFVSLFINPFYDPMEAYDIGLLIFTLTGYYPLTTLLM